MFPKKTPYARPANRINCHNNPVNGIDPTGMFTIPEITMSMAIRTIVSAHGMLLARTKQIAKELISGHGNYLNTLTQEKENNSATIITHGLITNGYGWASDFIDNLSQRAPGQDYYEFSWSGNPVSVGSVLANESVHGMATNSFIKVVRAVQAKGYKNVNIIGHSWGTVLSRDAQYAGVGNINTWFTMGSPLTASTMWPGSLGTWINIWNDKDWVVTRVPSLMERGGRPLYKKTGIRQLPLSTSLSFPDSHAMYWTNPTALGRIGTQLDSQR